MHEQISSNRSQITAPRHGLSLIEVVVSTALVGLLTVGALTTVGAVAKTRSVVGQRLMAQNLTQHLLTEILQTNYTDPDDPSPPLGLDTDETATPRDNFDDVDDFDGWDSLPPTDRHGVALADYDGWRREAFVSWVQRGTLLNSGTETGLKRIRVRVTAPNGTQTELVSLRTANGAGEQLPVADATVVTWVEAQLQIGANTPTTLGGTNLVNHANDE